MEGIASERDAAQITYLSDTFLCLYTSAIIQMSRESSSFCVRYYQYKFVFVFIS